jgi:hypothetical protein
VNQESGVIVARREFLARAVSAVLAGFGAAAAPERSLADVSRLAERRVADLFRDEAAAARVGRRHLERHPDERDRMHLLAALFPAGLPTTDAALRSHLAGLRQRDFATGRVVILDGWTLAVSEARLCALVELRSAGAT